MYEVLSMVYQEFLELFDTDVFHMGGDEVNMNCYNTSQEIRNYLGVYFQNRNINFYLRNFLFFNPFDLPIVEKENKIGTEEDILDLWTTFQTKAFGLVSQANKGQRMPAILWTNTMTEKGAEKYVSKEDYIIQVCIYYFLWKKKWLEKPAFSEIFFIPIINVIYFSNLIFFQDLDNWRGPFNRGRD